MQMVEGYRSDLEAGNHVANALVREPNKNVCRLVTIFRS
jgi:2-oxoglutarate dehydrogenase E1 component